MLLLFRRCTFLLLLLLSSMFMLSTSHKTCKNKEFKPDAFIEPVDGCIVYMCKINASIEFGVGSMDDIKNLCNFNDPADSSRLDEFENGNPLFLQMYKLGHYQLWKSTKGWNWTNSRQVDYREMYIESVKPLGNDSMQERFFWLIPLATLVYMNETFEQNISKSDYSFWAEKAESYIPSKLPLFTDEIHFVQNHVESVLKTSSLLQDFEDVQKAATQSLEESEYFQKKFVEMKPKFEAIKICVDEIFEPYLNKSNEILDSVKSDLNNCQNETMAAINALEDETGLQNIMGIQFGCMEGNVDYAEIQVLDILKSSNETMDSATCSTVTDDEMRYIKSAGYEARNILKELVENRDFKNLISEVKDAIKTVKHVGEAAQKTAEKAQKVAEESKVVGKNAENAAKNANQTAEKSSKIGKAAEIAAKNANENAEESKKIGNDAIIAAENAKQAAEAASNDGKNAEDTVKGEIAALRSNGKTDGGFGGALILSFVPILLII